MTTSKLVGGFAACAVVVLGLGLLLFYQFIYVSNEITIEDHENTVASAEVELCNNRLQLKKSQSELRGKMRITCEGDGIVLVRLSDARETTCKIGYVTPDAEQSFHFTIERGRCREVT